MNFPTHVLFGAAVGAVFFGKPEIIFLLAVGSAIPDLDREYGFFSKDSYRRHQVHRALCHNFLFIGLVYLVNPFLGMGAFLHTLLDALTTAKDRGVEWLYPFTRLVKKAVYDSQGQRLKLDPNRKVYLYQLEPLGPLRKTTPDIRPDISPLPWRRTYGPAVSGRLFDQGIFVGSAALLLLMLLLSALGVHKFIDLTWHGVDPAFGVPFLIGLAGGLTYYVQGEVHRKREANRSTAPRLESGYAVVWLISLGMMISAIVVGAAMNPEIATSTISGLPFVGAGVGLVAVVAFALLRTRSAKPVPKGRDEEPVIV